MLRKKKAKVSLKRGHLVHSFKKVLVAHEEVVIGQFTSVRRVTKFKCQCGEEECFYQHLYDQELLFSFYKRPVEVETRLAR
jgi:hypothetical protein